MAICDGDSDRLSDAIRLPGQYLFVAGRNLCHPLNSPARHLPYSLGAYVEQLDVVGYVNFYGGPPAPVWRRIGGGLDNLLRRRVAIRPGNSVRTIIARRLHLPTVCELLVQDVWLYAVLRRTLARHYVAGIVAHPDNALFTALLKRSGRVGCLIYNDWDYFPAYVPRRWSALVAWRERQCIRIADGVASVSRPLARLRREQGGRQVAFIPNGVDFERFHAAPRARYPHAPALVYAGSLDARWGVDLAIRALPMLRARFPDLRLLIAGQGPAAHALRALAGELGVTASVSFMGSVDYTDLPFLLAGADIGLATSRADRFRQYASPLKIAEYMAAGLPVICSGGGEAELMIRESGAGVNIAFEPEALAGAVESLLAAPDVLERMRMAGLMYARDRDWSRLGNALARFIAQLTGQPGATTDETFSPFEEADANPVPV
jgi:glycosyltransferase involved in cell wall biosynthesis